MRDRLEELGDISVAVVTFSDVSELAAYREHLGVPFPLLSDPSRALYRRFDLGRGTLRAVYGWGTLRRYAQLLRRGRRLRRPIADTRQLGGDFVIDPAGVLVATFRETSPVDRPTVDELVSLVRRAR